MSVEVHHEAESPIGVVFHASFRFSFIRSFIFMSNKYLDKFLAAGRLSSKLDGGLSPMFDILKFAGGHLAASSLHQRLWLYVFNIVPRRC